jgi:hypothetical protein
VEHRHVQRVPDALPVEASRLEEPPEIPRRDDKTEWDQDLGDGSLLVASLYQHRMARQSTILTFLPPFPIMAEIIPTGGDHGLEIHR